MKRKSIPAELRRLVRDDWSNLLVLNLDRAEEVLIRELWHVDESGRVMHPRLQRRASEWHNDLPKQEYSLPAQVTTPEPVTDRFNREEFESNPDSSDSSDSDNEETVVTPNDSNDQILNVEGPLSSDSEDESKNSTANHVMAMLNRVQGLEPGRNHDYDSDQSHDEDSPLHTPRSDALIRFSRLRKVVEKSPATVHAKTKYGVTPLLAAVLVDDLQAVKLFLTHNADPDVPDSEGRSPLWWAARLGLGSIIRTLIDNGATLHTPLSPPVLHLAVLSQDLTTVTALLAHKSVVLNAIDVKGRSVLHYAAALRNTDILTALINRKVDLLARDQQEMTPLFYAALYGPVRHVKLLVREGMQQAYRDFKTRKMKLSEYPLVTLQSLAYDPVDRHGTTPLFWAAWAGRPFIVRALLSDKVVTAPHGRVQPTLLADTRARDLSGRTALHVAVSGLHRALMQRKMTRARGVVDSVSLLIQVGANPGAVDHRDRTPLHVLAAIPIQDKLDDTCQSLLIRTADMLLKAGAPLAKQDRKGYTVLQLLAQSGCADVLNHVWIHVAKRIWQITVDEHNGDSISLSERDRLPLITNQIRLLIHHVLLGLKAYRAAKNNFVQEHEKCVDILLKAALSPTFADERNRLPIHLAARIGSVPIVRLLLEHAPNTIHTADAYGRTVLHLYLSSGADSPEMLRLLLERGASLTTRDTNGWTAVHWLAHGTRAIECYHVISEYLRSETELLPLLANTTGKQRSAFHVAARSGNRSFVEWVLTRVSDSVVKQLLLSVDQGLNTPAHTSLRVPYHTAERVQFVKLLLASSPVAVVHKRNSSGNNLLHMAVRWNNSELVNLLTDLGADLNAHDQYSATPIHEAVTSGAVNAVQVLLDRHCDSTCQDQKSRGVIHRLAKELHNPSYPGVPMLNLLITRLSPAQLAQTTRRGWTALHYLARYDAHDVTLLKTIWRATTIQTHDARDINGQTALHLATHHDHVNLVALLLELGASPVIPDIHGRTALHVAALSGHTRAIEHLLSVEPILVDMMDNQGMSALMIAAHHSRLEAVKTLLDHGASRMCVDNRGRTALHWAAVGGHVGCVSELWSHEIFEVEDNAGATALQLAWQHRQYAVFAKLENLLAQIYRPTNEDEDEPTYDEEEDEETHVIYDDDDDFVEPVYDDEDDSLGDRSEMSVDEADMDEDEDSFSADELLPVTTQSPLKTVQAQPEAVAARVRYADELDLDLAGVKSPRSPRFTVTRVTPLTSPTAVPRSPRYTSLARSIEEVTNRLRAHNASTAPSPRGEPSSEAFNSLVKLTASLLRARLMTLESHLILQDSKARLEKLTREHAEITHVKSTLAIELETLQAMERVGENRALTGVSSVLSTDQSYTLNHVLTTVLMITCCLLVILIYFEHSRPAPFTHVI